MKRDIERTETAAFTEGSLAHSLILEPHKTHEEFVIAPEINKRTKAGKAEWEAFCEANQDKTVVTQEQWDKCCDMASAVRDHKEANELLIDGVAEQSYFWTDEETGLDCKCRPDWFRNDNVVVDLKTSEDASPEGFAKSVANFRYHVQAPFYMDALGADAFIFVVVEKKPPYAVGIYQLDDVAMAAGRIEIRKNLHQIKTAKETGLYEDYTKHAQLLSLPAWALSKFAPKELKGELEKVQVNF